MPSGFPLPIDGDFYYSFQLTKPDGKPDTGLTDVTVSASQADGGAPVGNLPKYPAGETAILGTYAATFATTDMVAQIGPLLVAQTNSPGYVVTYQGSKTLGSDPCIFTQAARVGP